MMTLDPVELDEEQGSPAWIEARLGIPTASQAGQIVTGTGKPSTSKYIWQLLEERWTAQPSKDFQSEWMERGNALEPQAFDYYALLRSVEPRKVGLVYRNHERTFAASPDALVGEDGGLELKCPSPPIHFEYLAGDACPKAYFPQVQACMWATGRAWWDFMSYCPGLPELLVRCEPDPVYQSALDKYVPLFIEKMFDARNRLAARGVEFLLEADR